MVKLTKLYLSSKNRKVKHTKQRVENRSLCNNADNYLQKSASSNLFYFTESRRIMAAIISTTKI